MYKIFDISDVVPLQTESLGVKDKFWFEVGEGNEREMFMFKRSRSSTGEHWAEKIAAEIANRMNIPCAEYEIAKYKGDFGITTKNLVNPDERLIHGNELLGKSSDDDVQENLKNYQQTNHKISRVIGFFKASANELFRHPNKNISALGVFIGYLMLDVLISNQDRHNQNWGIIRSPNGFSYLCPTYDHGSSLGRNETEEKINRMLNASGNEVDVAKYVRKARSAFYSNEVETKKSMYTIDVLRYAKRHSADEYKHWEDQLNSFDENALSSIVYAVPQEVMSNVHKEFAVKILCENRTRILKDS